MYGDTVKETIAPATEYEGEYALDPNDCNALYYRYDKNGNRTETYYYTAVGQTDVESHTLETSEYDYAGRLVKTTNALGQSISYTYDAIGRKLTETDYKGNIVYYTYDALGNLVKQDSPFDGDNRSVKKLYYDAGGNVIKEMQTKNAVGAAVSWNVKEYAYDIMSRLSDVIVHVSTDSSGNTVKNYTHYEYNAAGDITAMYTGLSVPYSDTLSPDAYSKTTYTYDGAGLVTSVTDALNHTEYHTYNENKMKTSYTDRKGQNFTYIHNARGLTVEETAPGEALKKHFYDAAGRLTGIFNYNYDLAVSYTYNTYGHMTSESLANAGTTGSEKLYAYDLFGNRTSMTLNYNMYYPGIISQTYTYDALNRLASTTAGVTTVGYTYDANGNLSTETTGNMVTSYTYNGANLVTRVAHSINDGNPEEGWKNNYYAYSYYTDGNVRNVYDNFVLRSVTYEYDGADRLIAEDDQCSGPDYYREYSYDAAGNRIQKKEYDISDCELSPSALISQIDYVYDKNNRLLTAAENDQTTAFTYDLNGNMLTEGGKVYAYNSLNQLISLTENGQTTTYDYFLDGLRRSKTRADGSGEKYVWDGSKLIYYHPNDNSRMGYAAYYGVNGIFASSDWTNYVFADYLYQKNAHGDVTALIDNNGNVNRYYRYDAFGIPGSYSADDTNPFLYAGQYYDRESQSYYLRARYYLPRYGRFSQQDTHWNTGNMLYGDNPVTLNGRQIPNYSAISQGLNFYTYCADNPVALHDPMGTKAKHALYNQPKRNSSYGQAFPYEFSKPSFNIGLNDEVGEGGFSIGLGSVEIGLMDAGWEWQYAELSLFKMGTLNAGLELSATDGFVAEAKATAWSPSVSFTIWGVVFTIQVDVIAVGGTVEIDPVRNKYKIGAAALLGFCLEAAPEEQNRGK